MYQLEQFVLYLFQGEKEFSTSVRFFEVLVWIIAISQIMKHLDNIACYFAYAAGFAMGTFVGMILEEKLAIGMLVIRVILAKDECGLRKRLHDAGFGVTVVDAEGSKWGCKNSIYNYKERTGSFRDNYKM